MTSRTARRRRAPLLSRGLRWAAACALAATSLPAEDLERIVLRVNDEIATLSEYRDRRDARLEAIASSQELSPDERRKYATEAGRATMREMFDELLLLSRAAQLKVEASPSQIDATLDGQRQRFGLATEAELVAALAQSGMTVEQYRGRIGRSLTLSRVVQDEVNARIQIGDDELQRAYREQSAAMTVPERRRLDEVVVRDDSGLPPAERERLAQELSRLGSERAGDLAAAVAATGRAEAMTAVIEHGLVGRGALDPVLEAVAWNLAAGGVSVPVAGRGGLHVLVVREIQPATLRPYDEVKEELRGTLQEQRFETHMRELLAELERSAYVVENPPEDAAGFRAAPSDSEDPLRKLLGGPSAPPRAAEPATPPPTRTSGADDPAGPPRG